MEKICCIDNLLLAYHKAVRGKRYKKAVRDFSADLPERIVRLRDNLLSDNVQLGDYHFFTIHDPKLRRICAASFEEKLIHHAIVNVCKPYFERNLIYDTYATRDGKGVYAAIKRAQEGLRNHTYVAKLDVRKYFDSIDHAVLKTQLRRIFKDSRLLCLMDRIIESYQTDAGRGVPIGNLTSQYFANLYLSGLDHYIKEQLKVLVYVRYMDDILLFGPSKQQVKSYVEDVSRFIEDKLHLRLKPPVLVAAKRGISFLGYGLHPHKILLNRNSKLRFKQKMRCYTKAYEDGQWNDKTYMEHITPLLAFARKAYTRQLRLAVCLKCG